MGGKIKKCKDKVEDIKWAENPVKVLGLYVGHNKKECEQLNWNKKLEDMTGLFKQREKRNLTILGKILIIKALIIPKFTFVASVINVPNECIKEIESRCFKFISGGKQDKVKRHTLIGDYSKRGLKMIDINSYFKSLKLSWIESLVEGPVANSKLIPRKYFDKFGKSWLVFYMNINFADIVSLQQYKDMPMFYKDIIQFLIEIGGG